MAKAAKPTSNITKILFLGAVIAVIAFVYLDDDQVKKSTRHTTPPKAKVALKGQAFTDEDYKVQYPPLTDKPRNAFRPLLTKGGGAMSLPNGIPSYLAGGEGNWIYTGLAELDGKPFGLLENTGSGEGVFLQPGEKWKGVSTVKKVAADALVLSGPEGDVRIPLGNEGNGNGGALPAVIGPGGTSPVSPNLRGPIGNVEVTPVPRAAATTRSRNRGNRTTMNQSTDTMSMDPSQNGQNGDSNAF